MANENKYLSQDGLLYVWQKIKALLSDKVDVETGKGLSTNDYTTADKNKLAGIDDSADVNLIEIVKVNGSTISIDNKAVDIAVPTDNSSLTNGAGYQTSSDVSAAILSALSGITVESLILISQNIKLFAQ